MRESIHSLSALKARIAALALERAEPGFASFSLGQESLDTWLDGGLKRAQLHEILSDSVEDAGCASGFAAMLGLLAQQDGRPLVWLRTRDAERRGGGFHAAGFVELGGDPASLLLSTVSDTVTLLRTASDALRCSGLSAVIVECCSDPPEYNLTASRRLTLAAGEAGVTAFILRLGGTSVPSTADTRWSVRAASSQALEARAPGRPAFDVTLLRRRGGPAGKCWRVEWDRDARRFAEPALSGAVVPVSAGGQVADNGALRLASTA